MPIRTALGPALLLLSLVGGAVEAGDPPPPGERPRLVTQLGHEGGVTCATFTPDGRLLLTGGRDGVVCVWEAATAREIRRFTGHTESVSSVAASPDGRWAASTAGGSSLDGGTSVWDLATGETRLRIPPISDRDLASSAVFLPDGSAVVVASLEAGLRVVSLEEGHERRRIEAPGVGPLAVSPDGRLAATATSRLVDGDVHLWDLGTGREVGVLTGHDMQVTAVAFAADGRLLASASLDGTVRLWDVDAGQRVQTLPADAVHLAALALSRDGRSLAATGWDGTVRVWDLGGSPAVRTFALGETAGTCVAVDPDGRRLAAGGMDGVVRAWDLETGAPGPSLRAHAAALTAAALAPSGERAWLGAPDGTVRVWDLAAGGELERLVAHEAEVTALAVSPDARLLASTGLDMSVCLFSAGDGKRLWRVEGPSYRTAVAFSPTGDRVAVGNWDGTVEVLGVSSGDVLLRLTACPEPYPVRAVAYAPSGDVLLAGGADGGAALHRGEDGREMFRIDTEQLDVTAVAFASDGRSFFTAGRYGEVRRWSADDGRLLRRYRPPGAAASFEITSLGLLDGGRELLASGGGRFEGWTCVWDAAGGQVLRRRGGHGARIAGMAVTDGAGGLVLTASADHTARLGRPGAEGEDLTLVSFEKGRWAVVAPDGRFDADDPEAIEGLHWVVADEPLTPYPIEVFLRDYFEPRLLPRWLAREVFPPLRPLGDLNRLRPDVRIVGVEPDDAAGCVRVRVRVTARTSAPRVPDPPARSSGARDVRLLRDGRLLAVREGDVPLFEGTGEIRFDRVQLPAGGPGRRDAVVFSSYAFNTDGVKSATAERDVTLPTGDGPARTEDRVAWLVAFAVDRFDVSAWDLGFAVADGEALLGALAAGLGSGGDFGRVVPVLLASRSESASEATPSSTARRADLETVLRLLAGEDVPPSARSLAAGAEALRRARPDDLVFVSLHTHGLTDSDGRFHLLPSDGLAPGPTAASSWIAAEDLARWLRPIDAQLVLVVDACQAAASVEELGFKPAPIGSRGLGELAFTKRMRVLAASQASEVALESDLVRHGLLAYALVADGLLAGRADVEPKDGRIGLGEWLRYGAARVPSLAEEVARGRVRGAAVRGLDLLGPTARPLLQRPQVFDFTRGAMDPTISKR